MDSHIKLASERAGWVWKLASIVAASVAFGWAGHSWMTDLITRFDTKYQTAAGAEQDRERIRRLEGEKEILQKTLQGEIAERAALRKEFDDYRATQKPRR